MIRDDLNGEAIGVRVGVTRGEAIRVATTVSGERDSGSNFEGYQILKRILTNGMGTTRTLVLSDTNSRTASTESAVKYFTMIISTNESYWVLPSTLKERLMFIFCNDTTTTENINSAINNEEARERFAVQFRDMFAMVSLLQVMINVGILPEPDFKAAKQFLTKYFALLKTESPFFAAKQLSRATDIAYMTCRSLMLMRIAVLFAITGMGKDTSGRLSLSELADKARPFMVCPLNYMAFVIELNEIVQNCLVTDVVEALRRDILGLKYNENTGEMFFEADQDHRHGRAMQRRYSVEGNYIVVSGILAPVGRQMGSSGNSRTPASEEVFDNSDDNKNGGDFDGGASEATVQRIDALAQRLVPLLRGYIDTDIAGAVGRLTAMIIRNCDPGFGHPIRSTDAQVPAIKFRADGSIMIHIRTQWQLHRDFAYRAILHMLAHGTSLGAGLRGVMLRDRPGKFEPTKWERPQERNNASNAVSSSSGSSSSGLSLEQQLQRDRELINRKITQQTELLEDVESKITAAGKAPAAHSIAGFALQRHGQSAGIQALKESKKTITQRLELLEQALDALNEGITYAQFTDAMDPEDTSTSAALAGLQNSGSLVSNMRHMTLSSSASFSASDIVLSQNHLRVSRELEQKQQLARAQRSVLEQSGMASEFTKLCADNVQDAQTAQFIEQGRWDLVQKHLTSQALDRLCGVKTLDNHFVSHVGEVYTEYSFLLQHASKVRHILQRQQIGTRDAEALFKASLNEFNHALALLSNKLHKYGLIMSRAMVQQYWQSMLAQSVFCPPLGVGVELHVLASDLINHGPPGAASDMASRFAMLASDCFQLHRAFHRLADLCTQLHAKVPDYKFQLNGRDLLYKLRDPANPGSSHIYELFEEFAQILDTQVSPLLQNIKRIGAQIHETAAAGIDHLTLTAFFDAKRIDCGAAFSALLSRAAKPPNFHQLALDILFGAVGVPEGPERSMGVDSNNHALMPPPAAAAAAARPTNMPALEPARNNNNARLAAAITDLAFRAAAGPMFNDAYGADDDMDGLSQISGVGPEGKEAPAETKSQQDAEDEALVDMLSRSPHVTQRDQRRSESSSSSASFRVRDDEALEADDAEVEEEERRAMAEAQQEEEGDDVTEPDDTVMAEEVL
jgi:hypothetical protein